jgi:tetratricopeptide (TPR) repeat protein
VSSDPLESVQTAFNIGKAAFERGDYRRAIAHLEQAQALTTELGVQRSPLGGDVQVWLVTAYEAAGQQEAAIALCRLASQHPDSNTRSQAKRLLYILEAPRLQIHPEWTTQIPDLTHLTDNDGYGTRAASQLMPKTARPQPKPKPLFEQPDPVPKGVPRDNQFVGLALGVAVVVLGSLVLWATAGHPG